MGKNVAIVLAGGQGKRMNADRPKQFLELCSRPMLYYAIKAFEDSFVDDIVIVGEKNSITYIQESIVNKYGFSKVIKITAGGAERYESVYAGLLALDDDYDYVFIHDGARPCISQRIIERTYEDAKIYGGSVCAVPVKDTIKVSDDKGFAVKTPDRKTLWAVQTPQVFEYDLVLNSYESMMQDRLRPTVTDDSMVVENYSTTRIRITEGEYTNIKVTTPEDLTIAENIILSQND